MKIGAAVVEAADPGVGMALWVADGDNEQAWNGKDLRLAYPVGPAEAQQGILHPVGLCAALEQQAAKGGGGVEKGIVIHDYGSLLV